MTGSSEQNPNIDVLSPQQIGGILQRFAAETTSTRADPRLENTRAVVHVIPYIAEMSGKEDVALSPAWNLRDTHEVIWKARRAAKPSTRIRKIHATFQNNQYWSSSFRKFCKDVWPILPHLSVVVSHGNFMRNRICGPGKCPEPIPNGGVLRLTGDGKTCFIVRHCATCHNIDKRGDAFSSVCHNFDSLRPVADLVNLLKRETIKGEFCVYSSPIPRAILSAIALQRLVDEDERLSFCRTFGACSGHISNAHLERHNRRWACDRRERLNSPFCRSSNT